MSKTAPKEWFTAAQLADQALPGLPATKRGVLDLAAREGWASAVSAEGQPLARPRRGRGGGTEYHVSLLPDGAKAQLMATSGRQPPAPASRESAWARFDRLPASMKDEAYRRLEVIQRVEDLIRAGLGKGRAAEEVVAQARREARAAGERPPFSLSTVYGWFRRIEGVAAEDRVAYLAPEYGGRTRLAPCPDEAFELYKADYLRPSKPTHAACYRRLTRIAEDRGWTLPSAKTLQRRLEAEIPRDVQLLMREGQNALAHAFPHLTRARSGLRPMQIINLDGHLWDVRVEWPDGSVSRPHCLAVQDIASGKVLAVRFDRTLNQHLVRLALADTFRDFGLPETVLMDNGRENAAASISGGQSTRWRWKIRAEEPAGLLKMLNIKAVFATPYWGQAKPVERAFRDFAGEIAKHPALEGAYTGPNTAAKPDNYGARAIPIAEFEALVRTEVAVLNARAGRRGVHMAGRSYNQVFEEGVARHGVRVATAEQLRLCLASSQELTLDSRENAVRLFGARYWSPELSALKRQRVTVRFDPENLAAPVHVYSLDGRYLCEARQVAAGSFDRAADAHAQGRARRAFVKARRDMAAAAIRLDAAAVARALPEYEPAPIPDPKVVRPAFGAPARPEQAGKTPDFSEAWVRSARSGAGGG